MHLTNGTLLVSTNTTDEDYFMDAVVLLTEYNEQGATGFVINKKNDRPLNALVEFNYSAAFPLYDGGPVAAAQLFFIHRRADVISGGSPIVDDLFMGGDFRQAVRLINEGLLTGADIKIMIGYCGWDKGGLEAEIAEGSWLLKNDDPCSIFS